MRQVREVLRLRTARISGNEIARRLNLAPSTVRLTVQRLAAAGLDWPVPAELTDTALEARLFTAVGTKRGHRRHTEPDWAEIHRELRRKHVTLQLTYRRDKRLAPACAMPGCASTLSSRTSITAPRAVSTAPCSRSLPAANGPRYYH